MELELKTATIENFGKITKYMQKNPDDYYIFTTASCDTSNQIHTGSYKHLVICERYAILFKKTFSNIASVHEALIRGLIDVVTSIKQKRKIYVIAGVKIGLKSYFTGESRNGDLMKELIKLANEKAIELLEVFVKNDMRNMKKFIEDVENGYNENYYLKRVIEKEQQE